MCLRSASLDWLPGFRNGNSGADGGLEAAPSAANNGGMPGMAEGASNTVQELVKITDCSWQLCAQALQASNDDPQRAIQLLMQHKQGADNFVATSGGMGLPGALPGALPLPGANQLRGPCNVPPATAGCSFTSRRRLPLSPAGASGFSEGTCFFFAGRPSLARISRVRVRLSLWHAYLLLPTCLRCILGALL